MRADRGGDNLGAPGRPPHDDDIQRTLFQQHDDLVAIADPQHQIDLGMYHLDFADEVGAK
jgi:hypothetical protein